MNKFWFKSEMWGEEWQSYSENRYRKAYSFDDAAKNVAKSDYSEEPCNPNNYELNIEVKDEKDNVKKFTVTAEADVNFYVNEDCE